MTLAATFENMPQMICELMLKIDNLEKLITVPGEIKSNEIIDTKELCKRLNITEPTVIRWRKKGVVPFLNIGSSIRFNYEDVIQSLSNSKKKGVFRS